MYERFFVHLEGKKGNGVEHLQAVLFLGVTQFRTHV